MAASTKPGLADRANKLGDRSTDGNEAVQEARPLYRKVASARATSASDILALQRALGNQAVQRLIRDRRRVRPDVTAPSQAPQHGSIQRSSSAAAGDESFEQEAEQTSQQVVERLSGAADDEPRSRATPVQPPSEVSGSSGGIDSSLDSAIRTARGGGTELAPEVRAPLEGAFGADFQGVNVHTDSRADQLTRSVGARAFTTGNDIFFGAGRFDPGGREGQHLLAHELTHVVQQRGPGSNGQNNIGNPSTQRAESEDGASAPRLLASSLSVAPAGQVQAAPAVTSVTAGTDLGVGKSIDVTAVVAAGTPANATLTWTLVPAVAGVTITPRGKRGARIQAAAGALATAGAAFQAQAALTATPADNATSANINLVGITAVTFASTPAFGPVAALGGPFAPPANTADPNRDGLTGNTAVVNAVTAPAGRATTVELRTALGASAAGNVITPGSATGTIQVRTIETATKTFHDDPLTVNPVPLNLNAFPAQAALGAPYGCLNTLGWARSDSTANPLNRIVGETITAGGRDDFGFTASVNGGPNPAPTLALAVPANAWSDQLGTAAGPAAGATGDANQINVNRYEGAGMPPFPRVWILRQGFHYMGWSGNWSGEFDNGTHRRSLIRNSLNNYQFRSEHIFPRASSKVFNEPYVGPPLITLSAVTAVPLAPAAAGLAADGTATANLTVNTTVPGRTVNWNVLTGPVAFTAGAAGGGVGAPATLQAGTVAGKYKVRVVDSVFPNRFAEGTVNVVGIKVRNLSAPATKVPAGVLTATVNAIADPGGRTVNWSVDAAAAAAGVTIVGTAPGAPAAPARSAVVTRPAGFTGKVKITAADSVQAAKSGTISITFK